MTSVPKTAAALALAAALAAAPPAPAAVFKYTPPDLGFVEALGAGNRRTVDREGKTGKLEQLGVQGGDEQGAQGGDEQAAQAPPVAVDAADPMAAEVVNAAPATQEAPQTAAAEASIPELAALPEDDAGVALVDVPTAEAAAESAVSAEESARVAALRAKYGASADDEEEFLPQADGALGSLVEQLSGGIFAKIAGVSDAKPEEGALPAAAASGPIATVLPPLAALPALPLADVGTSFLSGAVPEGSAPIDEPSGSSASADAAAAAARQAIIDYKAGGTRATSVAGAPEAPRLRLVDSIPSWFLTLQGEVLVGAALAAIITGDLDPTTWSGDLERSMRRDDILKACGAGALGLMLALEVAHLPVLRLIVEPTLQFAGLTGVAACAAIIATDPQWEATLRGPLRRAFDALALGEPVVTKEQREAAAQAAAEAAARAAAERRAAAEEKMADERAEAEAAIARAAALSAEMEAQKAAEEEADAKSVAAPEEPAAPEATAVETETAPASDADEKP